MFFNWKYLLLLLLSIHLNNVFSESPPKEPDAGKVSDEDDDDDDEPSKPREKVNGSFLL